MGAAGHSQGNPRRPTLASSRSFEAVVERRREKEADIRYAIHVAPLGVAYAVVKNQCNDATYVVANNTGRIFSEGAVVMLGSNTGHQGEAIIAGAPPGRGGAAVFGSSASRRSVTFPRPEAPAPPIAITEYVGFYDDAAGSSTKACHFNSAGTVLNSYSMGAVSTLSRLAFLAVNPGGSLLPAVLVIDGSDALWSYRAGLAPVGISRSPRYPKAGLGVDGYFYWVEQQRGDSGNALKVRCMRDDAALGGPVQIGAEVTLPWTFPGGSAEAALEDAALVVASDRVLLFCSFQQFFPTIAYIDGGYVDFTAGTFTGGMTSSDLSTSGVTSPSQPAASGAFFAAGGTDVSRAAAGIALPTDYWPFSPTFTPAGLSVSEDRSELVVLERSGGYAAPTDALVVHDAADGPWGDTPQRSFTPPMHPTLAKLPYVVLLKE